MSEIDCRHWLELMLEAERDENARLRRELDDVIHRFQNTINDIRTIINDAAPGITSYEGLLASELFYHRNSPANIQSQQAQKLGRGFYPRGLFSGLFGF